MQDLYNTFEQHFHIQYLYKHILFWYVLMLNTIWSLCAIPGVYSALCNKKQLRISFDKVFPVVGNKAFDCL